MENVLVVDVLPFMEVLGNQGFRVQKLPTPVIENHMEKNMNNEMDTGVT